MATAYRHVGEFDVGKEDWTQFVECLAHFFAANQITDKSRMKALLLSLIGLTTFKLLQNLITPEKLENKSYKQLVEMMKQHHSLTPSEIVQYYWFNSLFHKEGESGAMYLADLQALAEFCHYGASLEDMLCDRLVCRIEDPLVQNAPHIQESCRYGPCHGNGSQECRVLAGFC